MSMRWFCLDLEWTVVEFQPTAKVFHVSFIVYENVSSFCLRRCGWMLAHKYFIPMLFASGVLWHLAVIISTTITVTSKFDYVFFSLGTMDTHAA